MLVLSRKEGEAIRIADDIIITVIRNSGNRVTLGIEAPGNVGIVRGELSPRDENGIMENDSRSHLEDPNVEASGETNEDR